MGQHRLEPSRPRYGRLTAALASLGVTLIALLGGIGMLPSSSAGGADDRSAMALDSAAALPQAPLPSPSTSSSAAGSSHSSHSSSTVTVTPADDPSYPLPAGSGEGRRVVFSEGQQRVWLVAEDGRVERTYLVSGSLTDNLDPGTFAVYSRSEQAWGIDDSGTMQWFVRFTQGDTGAAIGFHDIPVDDGAPVQSVAQLGSPQSHGCIRQDESDAKAMWDFAPIDTAVVVTG